MLPSLEMYFSSVFIVTFLNFKTENAQFDNPFSDGVMTQKWSGFTFSETEGCVFIKSDSSVLLKVNLHI